MKVHPGPLFAFTCFFLAHLATIAVGVVGWFEPALSVTEVLGTNNFATKLFSAIFIIFGLGGAVARFAGWVRAEAVCVLALAGAFALWGVMVLITPASNQPAAGYFVIACFKLAWGRTLFWWTNEKSARIQRALAKEGVAGDTA